MNLVALGNFTEKDREMTTKAGPSGVFRYFRRFLFLFCSFFFVSFVLVSEYAHKFKAHTGRYTDAPNDFASTVTRSGDATNEIKNFAVAS